MRVVGRGGAARGRRAVSWAPARSRVVRTVHARGREEGTGGAQALAGFWQLGSRGAEARPGGCPPQRPKQAGGLQGQLG